jgi:hypothetical protein
MVAWGCIREKAERKEQEIKKSLSHTVWKYKLCAAEHNLQTMIYLSGPVTKIKAQNLINWGVK